jgi:hypothetical protein
VTVSSWGRTMRIAHELVSGPFSMHPPADQDSYGWLECALRLVRWAPGHSPSESIAVYVDDSVNRDRDFLPPVIRYVRWERPTDLTRLPTSTSGWPTMTVDIGEIRDWHTVQRVAADMQRAICAPPFVVSGLTPDRTPPQADIAWEVGTLEVFTCNGLQSLEYRSPAITDGSAFTECFLASWAALRAQLLSIERQGWREHYARKPAIDPGGRSHFGEWRYDPLPLDDGAA